MSYSVLVVGCGRIAGGFDMERPDDDPCTHAGAIARLSSFELAGCVDPDPVSRATFASYWSVPCEFDQIEEASDLNIDVVAICSPTDFHYDDVIRAMALNPQVIFCEKPVSKHVGEIEDLAERAKKLGIGLVVNYTRRWDPMVTGLKTRLETIGDIRSIVGFYNKGLINNGSHMLDLLLQICGRLRVEGVGAAIYDNGDSDPSYPVLLSTEAGGTPVHLVTGDAGDYSLFELQFIGSRGTLTMKEGGMYWHSQSTVASDRFEGYQVLGEVEVVKGRYGEAMTGAYQQISNFLTRESALTSSLSEAATLHHLMAEIRTKSKAL